MRRSAFINHSITNSVFNWPTNRYKEDTHSNVHRTHQVCQNRYRQIAQPKPKSVWDGPPPGPNEPNIRHCCLWVLLNLILCLQKGLYSINSRSIHSSNLTIYLTAGVASACGKQSGWALCILCDFQWKMEIYVDYVVCFQPL